MEHIIFALIISLIILGLTILRVLSMINEVTDSVIALATETRVYMMTVEEIFDLFKEDEDQSLIETQVFTKEELGEDCKTRDS